jgi:hypothetical protein
MIRKDFWAVLAASFLSAGIAVIAFAFLVENQIIDLQNQIDNLEKVVDRYGISDEVKQDQTKKDSQAADLTLNQIKNATYTINDKTFAELEEFRLVNGEYVFRCLEKGNYCQVYIDLTEGEQHEAIDYLIANLDQDKEEEAIAILKYTTGGSGVLKYLAVLDNKDGQAEFVDSQVVTSGSVNNLKVNDEGVISVLAIVYGEDDSSCCPSEEKTVNYKLENGKLINLEDEKN